MWALLQLMCGSELIGWGGMACGCGTCCSLCAADVSLADVSLGLAPPGQRDDPSPMYACHQPCVHVEGSPSHVEHNPAIVSLNTLPSAPAPQVCDQPAVHQLPQPAAAASAGAGFVWAGRVRQGEGVYTVLACGAAKSLVPMPAAARPVHSCGCCSWNSARPSHFVRCGQCINFALHPTCRPRCWA